MGDAAGPYTYITANGDTTCAASTAGEIECWLIPGSEWGVLPGEAPPGQYVAVSMDRRHACAVTVQGEAVCWGPEDSGLPLPALPPGSYTTISVGEFTAEESNHVVGSLTACATTIEGDLVCWRGINSDGRVEQSVEHSPGNYTAAHVLLESVCALTVGGQVTCGGWDGGGSARYVAMAVGRFVCAITDAGTAECGTPGIRGVGPDTGVRWLMIPPAPEPGRSYVALSTGYAHACALTDVGEAICWESVENKVARPDPVPGRYVAVSDGDGHTCALTEVGEAVCWGWNNFGQADVPEGRYAALSAGFASTCAITDGGAAMCWGAFRFGPTEEQIPGDQCWLRSSVCTQRRGRTRVPSATGAYPRRHPDPSSRSAWPGPVTLARSEPTGRPCVGENGVGTADLDPPPGPWAAIDAGDHHTCAIDATGEVVCWGDPPPRNFRVHGPAAMWLSAPAATRSVYSRTPARSLAWTWATRRLRTPVPSGSAMGPGHWKSVSVSTAPAS